MEFDPISFLRAIEVKLTASVEMLRGTVEEIHKLNTTSSSVPGLGQGRGFFRGINLEGVLDTVSSSTADLCDYTTEGGTSGAPLRKALLERGDVYSKAVREIGQSVSDVR